MGLLSGGQECSGCVSGLVDLHRNVLCCVGLSPSLLTRRFKWEWDVFPPLTISDLVQEEFVLSAIHDEGDFVTITPNKKLNFQESLEALFDTTDVREDVVGSTSTYVTRSAKAVGRAARDVGDTVVSTSTKVVDGTKELGTSIRATFTPKATESSSLLKSNNDGPDTDAGTFDSTE